MPRENPFPATAVTTFGVPSETRADLSYMRNAYKLLVQYLQTYRNKGLTVALIGAHGSGKTYVLSLLADQAAHFSSAPAYVVYAKADGPSFVDLYRQVMERVTRDDLVGAIRNALRLRAEEITGKAKATRSTSMEIERTGDLDSAYARKVIDPNELNIGLRRELEALSSSPDVGRRVAAAMGLLDDSTWGEAAFDWLAGRPARLPNEALQIPLFESASTKADETVVAVFEVVAALFRLASTPLVILVDQLENLIIGEAVMHTSSILKKLMEHLSLQRAMFVLAGTPRAWKQLPRDVRPRIAKRLSVGNLSASEASNLLKAYLQVTRLPSKLTAIILRIAGGNPREILQTAFQIHEETGGNFARATEELIRAAADKAGALQEREQSALETLHQVASEESVQVVRPAWREATELDRLVLARAGGALAVIFAVSSDRQAEAELGLRLTRLKRELAGDPISPQMLVVTIGYSSEQVRTLLSGISRVLLFNEVDFADELRSEFAKLELHRDHGSTDGSKKPDQVLLERLDTLEKLLFDIQKSRSASDQEAAKRFSALTEISAAPARRETEIRTRLELREGLDELSLELARGHLIEERATLRRLLVANEANVGSESFDQLGTIYLDALDMVQLIYSRRQYGLDGSRESAAIQALDQLRSFRNDVTRMLRQTLSPNTLRTIDRLEVRIGFGIACGTAGGLFSYAVAGLFFDRDSFGSASEFRVWVGVVTIVGALLLAAVSYVVIEYFRRPEHRYIQLSRYLRRLRAHAVSDGLDGING